MFFLFLDKNIGPSNEYPQHMFLLRNKKDISIFSDKKYLLLCEHSVPSSSMSEDM